MYNNNKMNSSKCLKKYLLYIYNMKQKQSSSDDTRHTIVWISLYIQDPTDKSEAVYLFFEPYENCYAAEKCLLPFI